jgi:cytoskeletal protein CcmA (bactofilin family)
LKWKSEPVGDLSGFLDKGIAFKGEISFKDTLRIDGRFEGAIKSGNTLIIGESADVNAEIEVRSLYVSGHLRGQAKVSDRIELSNTARVESDLNTSVLVVEEGAVFEGRCTMSKDSTGPRQVEDRKAVLKEFPSSK